MSADNYMAVKQDEEGDWNVWMVLGGYDDRDWEIPSKPYFVGDKLEALEWAHEYCGRELVEYGVVLMGNENIGRIEGMIENLAAMYGKKGDVNEEC